MDVTSNSAWITLSNVKYVVPEIIALVANVADIFLDSTLKLYIVESACNSMYTERECKHIKYDADKNAAVQVKIYYLLWDFFSISRKKKKDL